MRAHLCIFVASGVLLLGMGCAETKPLPQPGKVDQQVQPEKVDQQVVNRLIGLMTSYYLYPQPERIPELVQNIETLRRVSKDRSDPMTGFLAGLFRRHPDKVEGWIKSRSAGDGYTEMLLLKAVQLAGLRELIQPTMNEFGWPAERKRIATNNLALLSDLQSYVVKMPADQDLLWAAYFASGEGLYVQKILAFYIKTANSSDIHLDDIAFVTPSLNDPGKNNQLRERLQRYSQDSQLRLLTAAAALWSLGSNAAQHGQVHQLLARYVRQHEHDPAVRVLARQVAVAGPKVMRGGFSGPVQVLLMMTQDSKFVDTQLPEFLKQGGRPIVPDRIFDRTKPVFLAVVATIKSPAKAHIETEVISPDGRRIRCKPAILPSSDVKTEASLNGALVQIELDQKSPPGLYLAQITVRSTEKPFIFFGMSFLMEEGDAGHTGAR